MKRTFKNLLKVMLLVIAVSSLGQGCKKDETPAEPIKIKLQESQEKLTKFLSITLNTGKDKIVYNDENQEFIINGWYHQSLKEVQDLYGNANEYKANYEK